MTDLSRPQPRPGVLDVSAYVAGDERSPAKRVFKLSANETPLGPSPRAIEAYKSAADRLHYYPEGSSEALREAIARVHGIHADRIVCGNGSDELLHLLAQCYLGDGDEAIYTEHAFSIYGISTLSVGGKPVVAPERDETAMVDEILARVTDRTRIVFLANPNNPTGTYIPFDEVKRLHAGLPRTVLLVLDAAYAEYVRRNDYASGMELAAEQENVVMTRTFSKIFGLASLRIGWLYGPAHVVDVLNRTRGPFNVNSPAIAAGAAAIADRAHVDASVEHNNRWNAWLTEELTKLGMRVTPSVGNFLLIHFPDEPGKGAVEGDAHLRREGYVLRGMRGYGFPNALRLTIGSEEANRGVVEALRSFLNGAA
ncbi:histidinol phosphate aminotransferase apoenzyme [Faunimonas pinastri]|uniref:Histidinol-phosphate aminotransferase n=1 Tax=Faunimonas pinastri TaxID=1855383 RepID=A0A1H9HTK8_9HYPH|nr:histidinol-phosphate transaminase [Faunimonas pinastri]SEQ65661.1 histidinol phosphate aminotransferase apoenzyme [Faunimonas pinastri]